MARLLEQYRSEIRPALMEKFGLKNVHAVPVLERVVVNMGVGKAIEEKGRMEAVMKDLATITGQQPSIRKARKSISGFKLREGMPVGCCVTLRGQRMYEFLDRLINVVIPRIRDFRGLGRKFDGRGNYTLGLNEQIVFPEISIDDVEYVQGMNITLVVRNSDDEKSFELLRMLGMPFKREEAEV
jgi:large subunit ribosomal protein L5